MQDNDFIVMWGPSSLAEVVAVVVEAVNAAGGGASALRSGVEVAYVDIEQDVAAAIQYDAVDDDT